MIEILDIVSSINTILERIGQINTVLEVSTKVTYTIGLTSQILPELEEVSEVNLEEV